MLQAYDRGTVDRVDVFIANSHFVADRVKRHYGRDAEILAPPVDVHRYSRLAASPEEWYLMVSALAPYKRVDQAITACARLGRELKIIGAGPEEKKAAGAGCEICTPRWSSWALLMTLAWVNTIGRLAAYYFRASRISASFRWRRLQRDARL